MSKEKVFIVISHKQVLKKNANVGGRKPTINDWEIVETVEFVNKLNNRHVTTSKATADYLNRKVLSGAATGMDSYELFEQYVRSKYPKQLAELDASYGKSQVEKLKPATELISDEHGNVRVRTVFDQ